MNRFVALCLLLCGTCWASDPSQYYNNEKLFHQTATLQDDFYKGEIQQLPYTFEEDEKKYGNSQPERSNRKVRRWAKRFEKDFSRWAYAGLENLIHFSYITLRKKGYRTYAEELKTEWHSIKYQFKAHLSYRGCRDIGDFDPMSQWLADWYDKIEGAIGKPLCDLLHISDIKTFNYCVPVVFDPCFPQWDKNDYIEHFATDNIYHGLSPVVLYWVSYGVCAGATWGLGAFTFCGPIASGLEYLYEYTIADDLGGKIYDMFCDERRL